ncbi:hypothetical protein CSA37_04495 [Candidatus Fermentibacteria bacterium]|nr:MAG: hypothetical protein CSA37_04495 [Candidatus Fermentibacteria bacterium]
MRKTASISLMALSGLFAAGAFLDPPFLTPLLKLTCHRLPERSFLWTPGLCARCSFFWAGLFFASVLMLFRKLPGRLVAGLLVISPLVVDGLLQFAGFYESTNAVRLITGALAGLGTGIVFESGAEAC